MIREPPRISLMTFSSESRFTPCERRILPASPSLLIGDRQQQMLGRDILVFESFGFFLRLLEDRVQAIADKLLARSADLRKLLDCGLDFAEHCLSVDADARRGSGWLSLPAARSVRQGRARVRPADGREPRPAQQPSLLLPVL